MPVASGPVAMLPVTSTGKITTNCLLVKDSVGHARPTIYTLPHSDHAYGKGLERHPENCAATVLTRWNVKKLSQNAAPGLDYVSMNRNAMRSGVIEVERQQLYRQTHPVHIKLGQPEVSAQAQSAIPGSLETKPRNAGPLPSDKNRSFVYGQPIRPSTPVATLISDQYQREWWEHQEKRNRETLEAQKARAPKAASLKALRPLRSPHEVPHPAHHAYHKDCGKVTSMVAPLTPEKPLFKLSRFKSIPPVLSSRRSADDPAMTFGGRGNVSRSELFKVNQDEWLGMAPREISGMAKGAYEASHRIDDWKHQHSIEWSQYGSRQPHHQLKAASVL